VALALGEIDERRKPRSAATGRSIPASPAPRPGVRSFCGNEIVVLAIRRWAGDLVIDHDVMKDAIDPRAARRVLARLGGQTVAVLAKAEASPSGEIRGRRHTMLDDSDIHRRVTPRPVGGVLPG